MANDTSHGDVPAEAPSDEPEAMPADEDGRGAPLAASEAPDAVASAKPTSTKNSNKEPGSQSATPAAKKGGAAKKVHAGKKKRKKAGGAESKGPPVPLHPWLMTLAPVMILYAVNAAQIPAQRVAFPATLALLVATLVFFISLASLRGYHPQRAAFITTVIMVPVMTYGHLLDLMLSVDAFRGNLAHPWVLFALITALTALGVWQLAKRRGRLHDATKIANVATAIFVLFSGMQVVLGGTFFLTADASQDARPFVTGFDVNTTQAPDVYFIMLDGYPRADQLMIHYDFDNSPFLDRLEGLGFWINHEGYTNYPMTFLSLASTLHGEYLDDLPERLGRSSDDRELPYEMIRDNRVLATFQELGYDSVHYSSGWGPTVDGTFADSTECRTRDEFSTMLIITSVLRAFALDLVVERFREGVLCTYEGLAQTPLEADDPVFVMAHMMPPHPPAAFDEEGDLPDSPTIAAQGGRFKFGVGGWREKDLFRGQLQFVNDQMEQVLESILENSRAAGRPEPIIIFQSDHGSSSTTQGKFNHELDHPTPRDEQIMERMSYFQAMYLPDGGALEPYQGMSPVNSFRFVFDSYFGSELELLDDRAVFSWYEYPYRYQDCTERLEALPVYSPEEILAGSMPDPGDDAACPDYLGD